MNKQFKELKKKFFPGQNFADPEASEDYIANRPKTVDSLIRIKETFETHGLVFWLDFGTLLGAVRDGKVIPWDHDIDLGMIKNEEEFSKIIKACKELEKEGFEIYYFLERGMVNFHKKDSLPMSIHFYEIDGDKAKLPLVIPRNFTGNCYSYLWWIAIAAKYKNSDQRLKVIVKTLVKVLHKAYPIPFFLLSMVIRSSINFFRILPVKKIEELIDAIKEKSKKSTQYLEYEYNSEDYLKLDSVFCYGTEFKIPSNVDEHLSRTYGKDWRKPNPEYVDENDNLLLVKSKIKQKKEMEQKKN